MPNPLILVIIGSVRPRRIGPDIAGWVAGIGRDATPSSFVLVDLRNWPLPMDSEPSIPAHGGYEHSETRAWSGKVASADGYVFVTPQYNWGYPAPLKNAIDHLYSEWVGKPAAIVTYGGHGGGKCAAQLRDVLTGLKMRLVDTMPALALPAGQVQANSGTIDAAAAFAADRQTVIQTLQELHQLATAVRGGSA